MEWKIGEIKQINGEWYQCLKSKGACSGCIAFGKNYSFCRSFGECTGDTIFKKLEKVGESFITNGKKYQRYVTHVHPYILNELNSMPIDDSIALIEIKQNKEDMEENKLNLKPFDIQKARKGNPVCTRDGRKARIICFDAKCADTPIVALVSHKNEEESLLRYYRNGKFRNDENSDADLMMLPEKKEGWVNIDKVGSGKVVISSPYSTKEEAIHNDNECTIDTIKINWSE